MSQKPTIKIDGVEINQTTPYVDYDAWIASPLTKALNQLHKDNLDAAVKAEREACAKVCDDLVLHQYSASGCAAAIRARGQDVAQS